MKTFHFDNLSRVYKNNGQHLEYCLRVMFNQCAKADNRKGGADLVIDGVGYQVKSFRATLCHGANLSGIETEYAEADGFIFGDLETETAYIMSKAEFIQFATAFAEISRESGKNGGSVKMRLNRRFEEQRAYLAG